MKIINIISIKCIQKHVRIYNIKMLYFDKTDNSESIDVNKASSPRECIIAIVGIFQIKGLGFIQLFAIVVVTTY